MVPGFVIDIRTPQKFDLKGFWLGPKKPKQVVIFVHGLGGSVFGRTELSIAEHLIDEKTAVLVFNNRGHDIVSKLYRDAPRTTKGYSRIIAGAAHEKFTDCVDDIQGAVDFIRKQGIKNIYLGGHSTGCQKSAYWAYKTKSRGVKGIIWLAPVSDYAGALKNHGNVKLARAAAAARALVRAGKPHELLPASVWSEEPDDAQRFLSLYTPDSVEEIFSYVQPNKVPRILKSVFVPTLVLWAEHDEFADRPASEAAAWFEKNMKNKHKIVIVPGVKHSFRGAEKRVAREIVDFMKNTR